MASANPSAADSRAPTKILVRGVNWLGDAVMTTPAVQRLRQRFPDAQITLLAHQKLAELWAGHSALDRVLSFAPGESVWAVARRLQAERFDTAVVFPNSPRSALEVWLARVPQRIGYTRSWRKLFLTRGVAPRPGAVPMRKLSSRAIKLRTQPGGPPLQATDAAAHQSLEYLHLVAALGADPSPLPPRLHLLSGEAGLIGEKFGIVPGPRPIFGLNAGAEYGPAKRWPAERFVLAATEIHRATNCRWLVFGGAGERALGEFITQGILDAVGLSHASTARQEVVLNLAGRTSLREFMGLLAACRVVLTNDSGPMHVAAALGTPVAALFGSTSPELTGPPLGDGNNAVIKALVPCSPCFRRECPIDFRCMMDIEVRRVVEIVLGLVRAQA